MYQDFIIFVQYVASRRFVASIFMLAIFTGKTWEVIQIRLKKYLQFWGNEKDNEIEFHLIGTKNKKVIVDVDDYQKAWKLLLKLSKNVDIDTIDKKFDVDEKNILDFLIENDLIDVDEDESRINKFFGNYLNTYEREEVIKRIVKENILIIGLGTLGTSVLSYLLQFGVKKFVFIDDDFVSSENVLHQRIYNIEDCGKSKVSAAVNWCKKNVENVNVADYRKRISKFSELEEIILNEKISTIFWCCDDYKYSLISEVRDYTNKYNIPTYISGYLLGNVKAYILNDDILSEIKSFQEKNYDIITENAGIGLLGDLSAVLMIRLWLQKISLTFDICRKNLFLDFINLKGERSVSKYMDYADTVDDRYLFENIYQPFVINEMGYYFADDVNQLDEISKFVDEKKLSIFDEESKAIEEYQEILSNYYLKVNGNTILVEDFAELAMREKIDEIYWETYEDLTKEIAIIGIKYLQEKQKRFIDVYREKWREKVGLESALIELARNIAKKKYGKEMDYFEYIPFSETYNASIENMLDTIKGVDQHEKYLDYTGYINHVLDHNYLHTDCLYGKSCCVYNPRYNSSEIIIKLNRNKHDIFNLIHELGHGYYNSHRNDGNIDDMTSEVFSLLSEIRLMEHFIITNNNEFYRTIEERIRSIFIGMFSLDVYEKAVLSKDHITVDVVLECRRTMVKNILKDVEVINGQYSRYNMFLNAELVAGNRIPYMYPEAFLHAFYIWMISQKKPQIEIDLLYYIKTTTDVIDIYGFYKKNGLFFDPQMVCTELFKFWERINGELCESDERIQEFTA